MPNETALTPGKILPPEPTRLPMLSTKTRYVLGVDGIILLGLAFWLVFDHAFDLVSLVPLCSPW
jgi:hypothetical protein